MIAYPFEPRVLASIQSGNTAARLGDAGGGQANE